MDCRKDLTPWHINFSLQTASESFDYAGQPLVQVPVNELEMKQIETAGEMVRAAV